MNPLLQDIVEALGPRPMVQIVILTVNGTQCALIGPVVQDPRATELSNVTAIEFGDLIPLQLAAKMLSGEYRDGLGEHLQ
jgi:hypothetical protein